MNESNLAISHSFMPDSSCDYMYESDHKEEEVKAAEEIEKRQIDFELLRLLEIKDSEHYEDDEVKEAIGFYGLLVQGMKGAQKKESS